MNIKSSAAATKLRERVKTLSLDNAEKERIIDDQEREITTLRSELSQLRKQKGTLHG